MTNAARTPDIAVERDAHRLRDAVVAVPRDQVGLAAVVIGWRLAGRDGRDGVGVYRAPFLAHHVAQLVAVVVDVGSCRTGAQLEEAREKGSDGGHVDRDYAEILLDSGACVSQSMDGKERGGLKRAGWTTYMDQQVRVSVSQVTSIREPKV